MSPQIVEESRFFLYSILTGAFIAGLYDLIRILRRVLKHNQFFVALEDFVFWLEALFILFLMLYDMNYGVLRWFSIAGATLGMIVYKKIFGEHLVEFMSTILNWALDVVIRLILAALKPFFFIKKKLTGNIKLVKIALCKRKINNRDIVENHYES